MPTNWEVYEALERKFTKAMPQYADDLDIGINEAHCDRFGNIWDNFHEVEYKEFELENLEIIK